MGNNRITRAYREFPRSFWTLIVATFIDRLGGALVFPFLSLYVTQKFSVGMTQVGQIIFIFAVSSLFGSLLGGAFADRFGRKVMILFSLIVSGLSSLLLGFAPNMLFIYIAALVIGLFSNSGNPAYSAMVADLLPEEKRAEGYAAVRISVNLAMTIGPAIGGFLATRSYLSIFILDAVTSLITAGIVLALIPETKPELQPGQAEANLSQTFRGYRRVFRDGFFIAFLVTVAIMVLVYIQMTTTLGVYLRDTHAISPQGYGYIISLNAAMVVLFQFWVTRRTKDRPAMIMMALGAALYGIGFSMYGFANRYLWFLLAMVIITVGEMIVEPVSQAIVALLAPQDMRGRYMAISGLSWLIPSAIGPYIAGLIMDNYDPRWVWYLCGLLSLVAVSGYLILNTRFQKRVSEQSVLVGTSTDAA